MPVMDGFQVCQTMKQDPAMKDIPVIFLTARSDSESIIRGFQSGGVDYISKPFNSWELLTRVRTHIDLKLTHDQLKTLNHHLESKILEKTAELQKSFEDLSNAYEEAIREHVAQGRNQNSQKF